MSDILNIAPEDLIQLQSVRGIQSTFFANNMVGIQFALGETHM